MISDCEFYARKFREKAGQKPSIHRSNILISEEVTEYFDAETELEAIKELADIVYVAGGLLDACREEAHKRGWDLNEAVKRVHENNVGRMTDKRDENGKVLKDPNYPKVVLSDLV